MAMSEVSNPYIAPFSDLYGLENPMIPKYLYKPHCLSPCFHFSNPYIAPFGNLYGLENP